MSKKPYARTYQNIVKASVELLGIRNTNRQVLYELLYAINWQTGHACLSRENLMNRTGRSEKTVKVALQTLRNMGIIRPIAYPNGGHGRSPVYRILYLDHAVVMYNQDKTTGEKFTPEDAGDILNNRGKKFQQQGKIFPPTGVKNTPPTNQSYLNKGVEETPRRGQDDKSSVAGSDEEAQLFAKFRKEHGPTAALRMMDNWRRNKGK